MLFNHKYELFLSLLAHAYFVYITSTGLNLIFKILMYVIFILH